MNYGFVLDTGKCIGCHACSTACKSENEVPLGVNRTWVKYTETGEYPNARRSFQVTRCNHCANPPCVRICPVTAMYQRDDGIVEFDSSVCIGCKACMQACPYDAIYIDPNTNTAAKCHYCSHRTDIGLEPACVVVCPTHAIIAGDLDDKDSEISSYVAKNNVTVRKPEQGTSPKTFYVGGHAASLVPTAVDGKPESFIWADVKERHESENIHPVKSQKVIKKSKSGTPIRAADIQGAPSGGSIKISGKPAEQMVQVAYNAQHKVPWHWQVPAYIVTKDIAAGIFLVMGLLFGLGLTPWNGTTAAVAGATSIFFTLATTALLIADLEKPTRFLYIILRPQWNSWLTRGAIFLIGFSNLSGAWWTLEVLNNFGLLPDWSIIPSLREGLLWVTIPFAFGAAIYTAFLFGQAEGRDLWQSPLLPTQMATRAVMTGAGMLLFLDTFVGAEVEYSFFVTAAFAGSMIFDLFLTLVGEFGVAHASEVAARAAHQITHGKYKTSFWLGSIVMGHLVPLALLLTGMPTLSALAGILCIIGLYFMENAFVMSAQEVPNS